MMTVSNTDSGVLVCATCGTLAAKERFGTQCVRCNSLYDGPVFGCETAVNIHHDKKARSREDFAMWMQQIAS